MSDTLIVCVTSLIGLAMLAGVYAYLSMLRWRLDDARARELQERAERKTQTISELQEHWSSNINNLAEKLYVALEQYSKEHERVAGAISAHSERIALFESALKEAIKQMVSVTGYSEEKLKELKAKIVREPGMRPRG